MLILARAGITFAAEKSLEKVMVWWGFKKVAEVVDYRLVLLGSMLPDIIDKPLGGLILKEVLGNGRIYSHTLIFLLFLFMVGMFLWSKYDRPGMLVLAGGSFFHYILDGMWLYPETFFWPVFGWSFPKGDPESWMQLWITNLLADPLVYVPEIIGGIILMYLGVELFRRKKVKCFIKTGEIDSLPEVP